MVMQRLDQQAIDPGTLIFVRDEKVGEVRTDGPAIMGQPFNGHMTVFTPGPGRPWQNRTSYPREAWQALDVADLTATLEPGSIDGEPIAKVHHPIADVSVYVHIDEKGNRHLIVDVDSESDDPPVRVYVNDAPAFRGEGS